MTWGYMAIYVMIAVVVSVSASVAIFMAAFNRRLTPDVLVIYVAAAAGAIAFYVSNRDLSTRDAIVDIGGETWVARGANLVAVGLCMVALVQIGTRGVVGRIGVIIAAATMQYYFVCFLMPVAFDRWFEFERRMLYPLLGLLLVMMPTDRPLRDLAVHFARAASIPAVLSLPLIAINYKAAVLESYASLLPFFSGRLYGATAHPNVLGAATVLAIFLLTAFPPGRKWEFRLLMSANVIALLLSQSKTSWLACIVGTLIILAPRLSQRRVRLPTPLVVIVLIVLSALPAAASLLDKDVFHFWAGNENIAQIGSLTGRTDIWQATLYLVSQHPIVGPGFATFQVYMKSLYPTLVADPHNLYLATAVQAGIVGLISFAIYLATLIIAAVSAQGAARRFGLAYIALIIVQGLSESFTFTSAFTAPTYWALIVLMRLMAVADAERRRTGVTS